MQLNGAVRYSDVDNVCLASSSRGSVKSALNRRDPEYHLLDGFLNFYVEEDLRQVECVSDWFILKSLSLVYDKILL